MKKILESVSPKKPPAPKPERIVLLHVKIPESFRTQATELSTRFSTPSLRLGQADIVRRALEIGLRTLQSSVSFQQEK
jgi:hypothetical protein